MDKNLQTSDANSFSMNYQRMIDGMRLGAVCLDAEGKILSANPFFISLMDITLDALVGRPFVELIQDGSREQFLALLERKRTPLALIRLQLKTPRVGRLVPVHLSSSDLELEKESGFCLLVSDETAAMLQEQKLLEGEERYRLLFEFSPHPTWVVDAETLEILAVNETMIQRYGYSRAEFLAMTVANLRPPEERPAFLSYFQKIKSEDRTNSIWRHQKKDGTLIDVDVTTHLFEFQGRLARMCMGVDITERRRAERQLKESEQRFRELAENIQEVFWITDPQKTQMLYVSPSYEKIWGRSIQSLYERPVSFSEAIHGDDRARAMTVLAEQSESYDIEYRIVRPDGSLRWIRDRAYPIFDASGKILRIVGIAEDITGYKNTSEALEKSQARLNFAQRQAHLGSWELDLSRPYGDENNNAYCSEEVYRIFGIEKSDEQVVHRTLVSAVHPEDRERIRMAVREAIANHAPFSVDFRIRRPNGDERFVLGQGEALYDEGGKPIRLAGTHLDITERRILEEQVRQAQKMESIGRLAGGVAHDFNNILTVIKGYVDLLRERFPAKDQAGKDLAEIEKSTAQASRLTGQLLAFSRKQVVQARVVDLHEIIGNMQTMLARLIGEDISLETQLQAAGSYVWMDPGQMEQILLNLSANARDAMPHGGCLTFQTMNVDAADAPSSSEPAPLEGRCLLLSVKDSGSGMDPNVVAHLFEPFFTTKAPGMGTGLGLATVYGIIRQCGGRIAVETLPGAGTVFQLYFPLSSAPVDPPVDAKQSEPKLRGKETILVVEDEPNIRQVIHRSLDRSGYQVYEAANGEEAIKFLGLNVAVDLVITDMIMPKMGGEALTQEITRKRPDLRILYMSGYTDRVVMETGLLTERSAFIQKPFEIRDLLNQIRLVLDRQTT